MPDRFLLRLNLHFFDDGDKTEKATPRKREKARGEGQVAKSNEIGTAFLFLTAFATLKAVGETMFRKLLSVFTFGAGLIPDVEAVFSPSYVTRL
ncbi:MAG: EscU/YscU/HrcU family type III secretion system export apparatus switch protein, partial [Clostridiales bacterium]|nr:EscU/YscU/HrcU family type III secretion system export apparatus switch protein [Clostridiales bacterium]